MAVFVCRKVNVLCEICDIENIKKIGQIEGQVNRLQEY